ncbi:MAG TPA: aminoacyl--tRNA ligase-related protein [Candidatus Bipolaricaulota bacterium]|nr:aminoacyl--tRNA ligase-related protein [Candidatus Bipolaricaulota bacterium]
MLQSKYFLKTTKEKPKDETSINAELLIRGGFIDKLMAGVYSFLPIGFRVLNNIKNIVRDEMNKLDAQELLMPALHPKEIWEETGRWEEGKEIMFQFEGRSGKKMGLGWTHEEIITDIIRKKISSYKDLPVALYQIQDKFRNEPRAKSGLLRGVEFSMKDLYGFHRDMDDFDEFYARVKESYLSIFKRCGLDSIITEASGGDFTEKYSHEFQVICPSGEDTIIHCTDCDFSQNKEIVEKELNDLCPKCGAKLKIDKAIEVGNIFTLETKYTEQMKAHYTDEKGVKKPIIMGCYGLGPSRVMGAVAEIHHDSSGLIWPWEIAPFKIHLVAIGAEDDVVMKQARELYDRLSKQHPDEILFDDREDKSAGEKLAESDLLGLPLRIIVSPKSLEKNSFEIKHRNKKESELIKIKKFDEELIKYYV